MIDRNLHKSKLFIITLLLILIFLFSMPLTMAFAATSGSAVLEDLGKDTSFNVANYPTVATDYSLQVIQIAESAADELLVYVYQPCVAKDFRATAINISSTLNDSINYIHYDLIFLNSSGTLYKYKVEDFTVASDNVRYYAVASIFRAYDSNIDEDAGNNNTIDEVSYAVNKQWSFGEINGQPYTNCVELQTIEITDKYVGFVRYQNGLFGSSAACDSHFVAFSTDKEITDLLEADVYYQQQSYNDSLSNYYGSINDKYVHLTCDQNTSFTSTGIFNHGSYTWSRIQSISEFISGEETEYIYKFGVFNSVSTTSLTETAIAELQNDYNWVLRFTETEWSTVFNQSTIVSKRQLVGNVSILRLKFVTDGIVYNLGVIDNVQTGSGTADNVTDIVFELSDSIKNLIGIVMLVLLIVVLAVVITPIFNVLKIIFKTVYFVVSLPFKCILGRSKNTANNKSYPSAPQSVGYSKKYKYRR